MQWSNLIQRVRENTSQKAELCWIQAARALGACSPGASFLFNLNVAIIKVRLKPARGVPKATAEDGPRS